MNIYIYIYVYMWCFKMRRQIYIYFLFYFIFIYYYSIRDFYLKNIYKVSVPDPRLLNGSLFIINISLTSSTIVRNTLHFETKFLQEITQFSLLDYYLNCFVNVSGSDLLNMSREDFIQICGPADGIRLFNAIRGR